MIKKIQLLVTLIIDREIRSRFISVVRRAWYRIFYSVDLGKGTAISQDIQMTRFAELTVGNYCYVGKGVSFEVGRVWEGCKGMTIGDRVWISSNSLLQCLGEVNIGSDVIIGEMTSIRDTRHGTERLDVPMKKQKDIVGSVLIKNNVWIGRGCLVLGSEEGIVVGEGSIIGANSVVTKSIPENEIWGGVPAKFIKKRNESDL